MKNPTWNLMKNDFLISKDDSMTCVVSPLEANNNVGFCPSRSVILPLPSSPHWAPIIASVFIFLPLSLLVKMLKKRVHPSVLYFKVKQNNGP